jgi:hypothetical protein
VCYPSSKAISGSQSAESIDQFGARKNSPLHRADLEQRVVADLTYFLNVSDFHVQNNKDQCRQVPFFPPLRQPIEINQYFTYDASLKILHRYINWS